MENASKALLIAGAILIVIILISIMLIVKNNVSDYYASEEQLKATEDKAKFNEQFTRFNRNDVQGYELISLVNKVVDYNERISEATSEGNDNHAKPVQISISLHSNDYIKNKLAWKPDEPGPVLFKNINLVLKDASQKAINKTSNTDLKGILDNIKDIEMNNRYVNVLVKKIDNIMPGNSSMIRYMYIKSDGTLAWDKSDSSLSYDDKKNDIGKMYDAIRIYQAAVGNSNKYKVEFDCIKNNDYGKVKDQYEAMIKDNALNLYKYYEFVQFKKAKFKCTKLHYDEQTGKVDELNFEFTGKIE